MGLIRAIADSVKGGLADQWLEVIEPLDMSEGVVYSKGMLLRRDSKHNSNVKGTVDVISNGSVVHVYENQFFMLIDGGQIVDYTAEPGYFTVDNSAMPSLFGGQLWDSVKETFNRFRFAGITPLKQFGVYINTQEIKGIKFGTVNPINYFDNFYQSELFLRAHGDYSVKITDPILFYREVVAKDVNVLRMKDVKDQFLSEFLDGLQASINKMSVDGVRISHVVSKSTELSKYMQEVLDEDWRMYRGMEVQKVGIASISYDEESKELINMRNKGAMLGDPNVREGYVQGSIARGIEAAGSNESGSAATFMGMGMGLNTAGGFMGQASAANQQQMIREEQQAQQAQQAAAGSWNCPKCSHQNNGNFCANCGEKKPEAGGAGFCSNCGTAFASPEIKFCPECGTKRG